MTEKPVTEKPQTREQLRAVIADFNERLSFRLDERGGLVRDRDAALVREKATRAQFDDLKQRLALAESLNQRMRGYIDRVQEDDVVREDLIKVGDPDGPEQLVPKRKPTHFSEPSPFGEAGCTQATDGYMRRERKPPKHWVTY